MQLISGPGPSAADGDKSSGIPSEVFKESVHLNLTSFKARVSPSVRWIIIIIIIELVAIHKCKLPEFFRCELVFSLFVSQRFFVETIARTSLYLINTWIDVWVSISLIASSVGLLLPFCCLLKQVINNQPWRLLLALSHWAWYISLNKSFPGFWEHQLL